MGVRVVLKMARASFPKFFVPRAAKGSSKLKYGGSFLIPANDPVIQEIQNGIIQVCKEEFGLDPSVVKPAPWYPGEKEGHPGMVIIRTANTTKPITVDQNNVETMDQNLFYPGCYVEAHISIYGFREPSKGVTFGLDGVKFVQHGDRLDNRPTAEQMFGSPNVAPAPMAPGVGGAMHHGNGSQAAPAMGGYAPPPAAPAAPANPFGGSPAVSAGYAPPPQAPAPIAPGVPGVPTAGGYAGQQPAAPFNPGAPQSPAAPPPMPGQGNFSFGGADDDDDQIPY